MSILSLRGVRSYSHDETVQIDISNYVTLIYGQNGAGKSTISGYFYPQNGDEYGQCSLHPPLDMRYLVFNHQFVEDLFNSQAVQPGIFTLSEENTTIAGEILQLEADVNAQRDLQQANSASLQKNDADQRKVRGDCANKIFSSSAEIRSSAAGDLMVGAKRTDTLYQKIMSSPDTAVTSTELLCEELKRLEDSKGNLIASVDDFPYFVFTEEELTLLKEPLVPAGDSVLAAAVRRLSNSDWIARGAVWFDGDICPFCQSPVDGEHLRQEITALFDRSWETAMSALRQLEKRHSEWKSYFEQFRETVNTCPLVNADSPVLARLYELEQKGLINQNAVSQKIAEPSVCIHPQLTLDESQNLQQAIAALNMEISENNRLAKNYATERTSLTDRVYAHIRHLSSDAIEEQRTELKALQDYRQTLEVKSVELRENIATAEKEIAAKYSSTVNINSTIQNINNALTSMGIDSFHIVPCEEGVESYRLSRAGESTDRPVFQTLSEGEKTLIAFLYFIETCKGRNSRTQSDNQPSLIVIDDPISSLSQNYIFEVAALIQHEIIKSDRAAKVVLLTHSLFFFQELLLSSGSRPAGKKPADWQLYRIAKNRHSTVSVISDKELLNDYQALWYVLRKASNDVSSGVIIPNVMRQILEHYFSFSGKNERLYKALDTLAAENRDPRFNAFYRFINRHSHADSRNIRLQEEASADMYIDMFKRVFVMTEDLEHYDMMMTET
jgi:wobble nucleotide-excising tRNase